MKPTLFVLAAGMGCRYGGLKELDGVGPYNQTIMDYSIFDAIRAGFGRVVFVIKREFEKEFSERVISKYKKFIPVELVFQSLDVIPKGFRVPEKRVKQWGTNHAVMMGEDIINEPFAVINADDFYGRESFKILADELVAMSNSSENYCMVGYRAGNTLSKSGPVARGICSVNADGYLTEIVERAEVLRVAGSVAYENEKNEWVVIDDQTPVSMNMWGFTPQYFNHSTELFKEFLFDNIDNKKAEFFIPFAVNKLVKSGVSKINVLDTPSKWIGVSYAADRAGVVAEIKSLIEMGEYPANLWE